jgi:hypothetical protein
VCKLNASLDLFFRVSAAEVRLNRLPGWEGQSWGYHGDDGNVFSTEFQGRNYGPTYTSECRRVVHDCFD